MTNWKLFFRMCDESLNWLEWESYGNLTQATLAAHELMRNGLQVRIGSREISRLEIKSNES